MKTVQEVQDRKQKIMEQIQQMQFILNALSIELIELQGMEKLLNEQKVANA